MNKEQVRQIFREELARFVKGDRFVFDNHIQLLDARNIQVGKTNGTMIGTESTQKLAFYGTAPIAQQNAISSPSGASTISAFPFSLEDDQARNAINGIILTLSRMGITK